MNEKKINIPLSQSEALVLFDFLSRFSEKGKLSIDHPSEERVLWDINCILEETLSEPLSRDYYISLNEARESIVDESK